LVGVTDTNLSIWSMAPANDFVNTNLIKSDLPSNCELVKLTRLLGLAMTGLAMTGLAMTGLVKMGLVKMGLTRVLR
jgi:hypothetical protein